MIVDPAVSRRKFALEVEAAKKHPLFHQQGIWILRAEYPIVFVIIVTSMNMPSLPGVLTGVHINFTDYDVRPPSVYFVDPFNERPLNYSEISWKFPRANSKVDPVNNQTVTEFLEYVQSFDQVKPFFCSVGVREYHECSAHSGDSWFLHRGNKGNLLVHLLTIFQKYGPNAVAGVQFQVMPFLIQKAIA